VVKAGKQAARAMWSFATEAEARAKAAKVDLKQYA
jgi:hypothetical protein